MEYWLKMKNINQITVFDSFTENIDFIEITTLITAHGISTHGSICCNGKTLLANYVYKKCGTYELIYTILDPAGYSKSFIEEDGTLPTLFLSPKLDNYVSIVPYDPDKELEISIPLFNRENTKLPKGNRPFSGNFIGVSNQFSIFYDVETYDDKKPDKFLAMEFKNEALKKKHNIKVPLPNKNKIFIKNNEIHLLSNNGFTWLHRQIDEKGCEVKRRELHASGDFVREIISLSFTEESYVLCSDGGKIVVEKISKYNVCKSNEVLDIKDDIFNMWQPIKISDHTFVTRFNTEYGNGWLVTKNDSILELYYSKDTNGYKELVSGKVLVIKGKKLIISSINKAQENAYSVVLYPRMGRGISNKEIIVIHKNLNGLYK